MMGERATCEEDGVVTGRSATVASGFVTVVCAGVA
jgi:hypothetical protein